MCIFINNYTQSQIKYLEKAKLLWAFNKEK